MFAKTTILAAAVLTIITCTASAQCLGTQSLYGDDLSLSVEVNGSFVLGSNVTVNAGDSIELVTGTIDYAGLDHYILADFGSVPAVPVFPGICVTLTASTIVTPAGPLNFEGTYLPPVTYPGGAAGVVFTLQSMVISGQAANGIFATSDPLTLTFN